MPKSHYLSKYCAGGLSHQVHDERAGFNNPTWDSRFLDLFERDPEQLAAMTIAEYAELGGFEGAEVVMWLTMRGALSANVACKHRSYYLPSMTGIATAIYEGTDEPNPAVAERQRRHVASQLSGVERLEGTYPFTLERSVKAFRINDYLHRMVEPSHREAFVRDPEASFEAGGLTEEERDLLRRRDWRGLMHYGAIFFVLEKLGAVIGVSNLHIYTAMRGESLEVFQRTRNAPGALYSVAGKGAGNLGWDKAVGTASHS
jgi:gallate dioxygenase